MMRLLASLALGAALAGCAPPLHIYGSARRPSDADVRATIDAVAIEAGVDRKVFAPLLVEFDSTRWWRDTGRTDGRTTTGITWRPDYVWILVDDRRTDVCSDALAHELVHVLLWRTSGEGPDSSHARPEWAGVSGAASLEARSVARVCKATERAR